MRRERRKKRGGEQEHALVGEWLWVLVGISVQTSDHDNMTSLLLFAVTQLWTDERNYSPSIDLSVWCFKRFKHILNIYCFSKQFLSPCDTKLNRGFKYDVHVMLSLIVTHKLTRNVYIDLTLNQFNAVCK